MLDVQYYLTNKPCGNVMHGQIINRDKTVLLSTLSTRVIYRGERKARGNGKNLMQLRYNSMPIISPAGLKIRKEVAISLSPD